MVRLVNDINEWGIYQTNLGIPFYRNNSFIFHNNQSVDYYLNNYFDGWNIDGETQGLSN